MLVLKHPAVSPQRAGTSARSKHRIQHSTCQRRLNLGILLYHFLGIRHCPVLRFGPSFSGPVNSAPPTNPAKRSLRACMCSVPGLMQKQGKTKLSQRHYDIVFLRHDVLLQDFGEV